MNLLSAIKKDLERVLNYTKLDKQHVKIDADNCIIQIYGDNKQLSYIPSETGIKFHKSNANVKIVMGPFGSGKTVMSCAEIVRQACSMPRCIDGIRRYRAAIIRNTYSQLKTTTYKTWCDWFSELGEVKETTSNVFRCEHKFNDGHGPIEMEILFLALDRPKDIGRFKSLEITSAMLDEISELPEVALMVIKGRINRYPPEILCKEPYHGTVFSATNPPDTEHWIYKLFEVNIPDDHEIFHQPPGLLKNEDGNYIINKNADNYEHLSNPNYYLEIASGADKEFIKVYCLGEYGILKTGKVVFPSYNDNYHAVDSLKVIDNETIVVAWDFGLTPAALIVQLVDGQLRCLKEFVTDRMGIIEFIQIVLPYIRKHFPTNPVYSTCDPAGMQASQITATTSAIEELNRAGLPTVPASTNDIVPRIDAVNFWLNKMSMGHPAFVLLRSECPVLRKGFMNSYVYERLRILNKEEYKDVPIKSHPFSDIQDCLQYAALYYNCLNNHPKIDKKEYFNQSSSMWV
jgi:hypothetical protein